MTKPNPNAAKDVLDWLNARSLPDWTRSRALGGVATLLILLYALAIVALVVVLVQTLRQSMSSGTEGVNLGAGALIAALLGAPLVIWATIVKQRTPGLSETRSFPEPTQPDVRG